MYSFMITVFYLSNCLHTHDSATCTFKVFCGNLFWSLSVAIYSDNNLLAFSYFLSWLVILLSAFVQSADSMADLITSHSSHTLHDITRWPILLHNYMKLYMISFLKHPWYNGLLINRSCDRSCTRGVIHIFPFSPGCPPPSLPYSAESWPSALFSSFHPILLLDIFVYDVRIFHINKI